MREWIAGLTVVLLLNVLAGLVRIWRGPTRADRMLSAQLFGTTGVAILLLFADLFERPSLQDAALVLALLVAMAIVVFVQRVWVADRL
jgi:multicomponent Na+:H+ antiporter subunit F